MSCSRAILRIQRSFLTDIQTTSVEIGIRRATGWTKDRSCVPLKDGCIIIHEKIHFHMADDRLRVARWGEER